jgi:hypothetical protein
MIASVAAMAPVSPLRDRARRAGSDGTHIDKNRTGGKTFDQTIRPKHDALDIGTGRDDGKHNPGAPRHIGRRCTPRGAGIEQ